MIMILEYFEQSADDSVCRIIRKRATKNKKHLEEGKDDEQTD